MVGSTVLNFNILIMHVIEITLFTFFIGSSSILLGKCEVQRTSEKQYFLIFAVDLSLKKNSQSFIILLEGLFTEGVPEGVTFHTISNFDRNIDICDVC